MTNLAAPALALLAVALLAPAASAHGAAAAREVDARVLLDRDGALGFAGCAEGTCIPGTGLDSGALDLLAVDLREFRDANGTALLAFRTTGQAEAAQQAGRAIALTFTLGGQARTLRLEGDGLAYASADVDRVFVSPDVIGDGHAKAVEAWISLARLGAQPGDALTGIQAASLAGSTKGDIVPGTWFPANAQQQAVPYVPDHAPAGPADLADPAPGTYTLAGPASLLGLSVDNAKPDTSQGPATVSVTLRNPLKQLPQSIALRLFGPGLTVSGDAATANLDAGTSKTLTFTVNGPASTLNVTATSDLGGYASLLVPVANSHASAAPGAPTGSVLLPAKPSATVAPPASTPPEPTATTASTSKKSPVAALPLLLVGLALLAAARKR
jgi:hypothetical protein